MAFEDVDLQRDDLWKRFKDRGFLWNWKFLIRSKVCLERFRTKSRIGFFRNFRAPGEDSMY